MGEEIVHDGWDSHQTAQLLNVIGRKHVVDVEWKVVDACQKFAIYSGAMEVAVELERIKKEVLTLSGNEKLPLARCCDCRYFSNRLVQGPEGRPISEWQCRRNTGFVSRKPDDWCGEFSHRHLAKGQWRFPTEEE